VRQAILFALQLLDLHLLAARTYAHTHTQLRYGAAAARARHLARALDPTTREDGWSRRCVGGSTGAWQSRGRRTDLTLVGREGPSASSTSAILGPRAARRRQDVRFVTHTTNLGRALKTTAATAVECNRREGASRRAWRHRYGKARARAFARGAGAPLVCVAGENPTR